MVYAGLVFSYLRRTSSPLSLFACLHFTRIFVILQRTYLYIRFALFISHVLTLTFRISLSTPLTIYSADSFIHQAYQVTLL